MGFGSGWETVCDIFLDQGGIYMPEFHRIYSEF